MLIQLSWICLTCRMHRGAWEWWRWDSPAGANHSSLIIT